MNHFISVERGEKSGIYYLVIHTGSRNLGKVVFDYYQNEAIEVRNTRINVYKYFRESEIRRFGETGCYDKIEGARQYWDSAIANEPDNDLCYLRGFVMEDYLHDMDMLRDWSYMSHAVIAAEIRDALGITATEAITSIHNYVDTEHKIIRKGAIAAYEGERGIALLHIHVILYIYVTRGVADLGCKVAPVVVYALDKEGVGRYDSPK